MFHCFSSEELFCDEENMSIKRLKRIKYFVVWSMPLLQFYKNSEVERVSTMMCGFLLLTIRIPSTTICELDQWDSFSVGKWSLFISTQYANFHQSLAFILPVNFLLSISGCTFTFWFCWWTDDCFLVDGFQGQFQFLWFEAKECIQDDILLS